MRIERNRLVYGFAPDGEPVARIRSGDVVTLETHDTSTDRIHRPEDVPEFVRVRDPLKVNPACGPLYIEGAEPGDALAVTIESIELGPVGFVRILAGAGVLRDGMREHGIVMVRPDGDDLLFGEKLRIPARKMVGVLGTAPESGTVYTAHPGPQGSNMDFNAAHEGATVYLPVHVPGALLAIGDLHASMGDGEVGGTGVEIAGAATVRVEVRKGEAPPRPWIEDAANWVTTGQGETLEEAVQEAVEGMTALLMRLFDLDRTEAFLLVSACGDVRIGQCARIRGCDATAYVEFPKAVERLAG